VASVDRTLSPTVRDGRAASRQASAALDAPGASGKVIEPIASSKLLAVAFIDDVDPGRLPGSSDSDGDGLRRFRVGHGGLDERRELPPEQNRIGEHAQAGHLDVDDAADNERLDPIERSPKLFEEVDRRH
jgi:hypothetical protein